MRILADENITQVVELFSPYGSVDTVAGRNLTPAQINGYDALLVRSVTKVTPALLAGSTCRFVATATSGTDHIDLPGLQALGVQVVSAHGCNAASVVDYVFSALATLSAASSGHWTQRSVGIIGCGKVGSLLATRMLALGTHCKIYDPVLTAAHPLAAYFAPFANVLQQDIVSLHVPLTKTGPWPTYHMLAAKELQAISENTILINAARGSVIDNQALLAWLQQRPEQQIVLDTWEHEPQLLLPLLQRVNIGTPHIAGYCHEGKLLGTQLILQQFCDHFGFIQPVAGHNTDHAQIKVNADATVTAQLDQLILQSYDVKQDAAALRKSLTSATPAADFDALRKHYPERHEFSYYQLANTPLPPALKYAAAALGFRV